MKYNNKLWMMVAACGMLAATSCSDYYDYNSGGVASEEQLAADKTLWENISGNKNLSEFASVLERVGYDEILNQSHTYTVWAPVNESFNLDSLNQLTDEKVEQGFLKNLIADYMHRENDLNDTVIYMLNEKLLKFAGKNTGSLSFGGQAILPNANIPGAYNYPSTNGLLYLLSSPAMFRYNAYEFLFENPGVADSLAKYAKKYETVTIDEANSVKGPIINGVQQYDHIEQIIHNGLTERRLNAELNNEDSLYTVLIMKDAAWREAYDKIAPYYNYIPKIAWQNLSAEKMGTGYSKKGNDSSMKPTVGTETVDLASAPAGAEIQASEEYMTDSIVKKHLTDYMIFSENRNEKLRTGESFNENDVLVATSYGVRRDEPANFGLIRNLADLNAATEEIVGLSNGHARILNAYPFSPNETYARVIRTNDVARIITQSGYKDKSNTIPKDSLDKWGVVLDEEDLINNNNGCKYVYSDIDRKTSFNAPELDFYLPDVLSTTYDIYVVFVPACADDTTATYGVGKKYSLYFDLNYTDASNTQKMGRFNPETGELVEAANGAHKDIKELQYEFDINKVDTVKVGRMTFPICYYKTGVAPNLKVIQTHGLMMGTTKETYEQVLRIANIILRPVENEE